MQLFCNLCWINFTVMAFYHAGALTVSTEYKNKGTIMSQSHPYSKANQEMDEHECRSKQWARLVAHFIKNVADEQLARALEVGGSGKTKTAHQQMWATKSNCSSFWKSQIIQQHGHHYSESVGIRWWWTRWRLDVGSRTGRQHSQVQRSGFIKSLLMSEWCQCEEDSGLLVLGLKQATSLIFYTGKQENIWEFWWQHEWTKIAERMKKYS